MMSADKTEIGPEDEAAIVAFMQRVAVPPSRAKSLPSAESVLRQTYWRRRWEGERRMHAPLDFVLPLAKLQAN